MEKPEEKKLEETAGTRQAKEILARWKMMEKSRDPTKEEIARHKHCLCENWICSRWVKDENGDWLTKDKITPRQKKLLQIHRKVEAWKTKMWRTESGVGYRTESVYQKVKKYSNRTKKCIGLQMVTFVTIDIPSHIKLSLGPVNHHSYPKKRKYSYNSAW